MRKVIVGACLCTIASGVAALSLGPSRGAVVLGAPIDLMFELRPDAGQDLASSCLSARLVSGASVIADSRVQVTPVLGGPVPMVRVQARITADEPVLTVTLAAGCEGRVTRTYTFLADPPSSAQAATQRPLGAVTLNDSNFAATHQRSLARRAPALEDHGAAPLARDSVRPARAAAPKIAERPARPRALAPAPAAPARLLVEPLDLWLDTPLTLRLSRDEPLLLSAPDEAKRAQFASLWKALNASPESLQESMALLEKLQAESAARGPQEQAEKAATAELRQRLEQVQEQSFSATWVYGLGGLLALAVGCIAWLLRRSRRQELKAWEHSVARSEAQLSGATTADARGDREPWEGAEESDTWSSHSLRALDEQSDHLPVDAPDTIPVLPSAAATAPAAIEPQALPATPKAARAQQILPPDAVFDIQQQADFFVSIGEHEQAIDVLRTHIDEHGDAMPWAYLESLRLFHMLGRTETFNRLREQFQARFNVRVPGFGQFHDGGRVLEDYPEALAQVEALWSSPEVMGVLDGFLFLRGDQRQQGVDRFDLAAFDDLLLLLAIAQTTPAHLRGDPPPRKRTTPRVANRATLPADRSLDSIAGDLALMPSGFDVLTSQPAPQAVLDVDLSQAREPDLSLGGEATAANTRSVGFGMENDKLELRFELDQMDKKR